MVNWHPFSNHLAPKLEGAGIYIYIYVSIRIYKPFFSLFGRGSHMAPGLGDKTWLTMGKLTMYPSPGMILPSGVLSRIKCLLNTTLNTYPSGKPHPPFLSHTLCAIFLAQWNVVVKSSHVRGSKLLILGINSSHLEWRESLYWVYKTLGNQVDEFITYHKKTMGADRPDRTYTCDVTEFPALKIYQLESRWRNSHVLVSQLIDSSKKNMKFSY